MSHDDHDHDTDTVDDDADEHPRDSRVGALMANRPGQRFAVMRHAAAAVAAVEGGLFAFVATTLSVGLVALCTLGVVEAILTTKSPARDLPRWFIGALGVTVLGWIVLDVPMLMRTWHALLNGKWPVAVRTALGQRRYTWWSRGLVATWWLAHFALGVIAAIFTERGPDKLTAPLDRQPEPILVAMLVLVYTLAANGFLLQAIAAVTGPRERLLARVWHWRIVIDVGITLVGLTVNRAV